MTMDKNAIGLIQATAIDAENRRLPDSMAGIAVALPSDYKLHNLEPYGAGRRRFRGAMRTQSIPDFVAFVKARPGGHGFIEGDDLDARVFFNLGTADDPGHADFTANLGMKRTPAFDALLAINGVPRTQKQITDFLEDWAHVATAYSEGEEGDRSPMKLSRAVAAIRKVKIEQKSASETTQGNFRESQSRLDSVEASSDVGLPDCLAFYTASHVGLTTRTFRLRLGIQTGGNVPMLVLRIIGLEQHEEEIAQEFKALLIQDIGDAATMTIGTFTP